jgi:hypothetical protein
MKKGMLFDEGVVGWVGVDAMRWCCCIRVRCDGLVGIVFGRCIEVFAFDGVLE